MIKMLQAKYDPNVIRTVDGKYLVSPKSKKDCWRCKLQFKLGDKIRQRDGAKVCAYHEKCFPEGY